FAKGPEGFVMVISNGVPTWTTNISDVTFTNVTVLQTINATTVKVNGKSVPALHVNATNTAPDVNIQDSATLKWAGPTSGSNWVANVRMKNYLVLASPHSADGVGAILSTNDNTLKYFGQAAFSGSA